MADLWKTVAPRRVGAGHVDDRGYGVGAGAKGSAVERRRAVRYVAGAARDAGDAALLLEALGLDPVEGRDGTEKVA
jgi:hypothetical protein